MSDNSIRLFTFAGIPVRMHWSFSLILIYIIWIARDLHMDFRESIGVFLFFTILFLCVVAHEFGHALTAKKFGIVTQDIILLPIGGIARLKRSSIQSSHEFIIAIAGPLVNMLIAAAIGFYLWMFTDGGLFQMVEDSKTFFLSKDDFLRLIFITNISLFVFNLLPAYPLDGGRMLKAVLKLQLDAVYATQIVSIVGQIMSLILIGIGIYFSMIFVVLIGIFVLIAAIIEYKFATFTKKISAISISSCMNKNLEGLPIDLHTKEVEKELITKKNQIQLLFNENGDILGFVDKEDIIASQELGTNVLLGDLLNKIKVLLAPDDSLGLAWDTLSSGEQKVIGIVENQKIIATLTMDYIKTNLGRNAK